MIRFQNEDMMRKWASGLNQQQKENSPQANQSPDQPPPNFTWMSSQTSALENPYAQHEEDDEDEEQYNITPTLQQYPMNAMALPGTMQRNSSSSSLRQRSATGESIQSLAGMARAPPPRFPMPMPPTPLSLQTQMSGSQASPGPRGGDSYFSPVAESPASSRASTTSGFFPPSAGYPFPKTGTPQPGGWGSGDDSNRYTAPAMPRAPSRDGPSPANAYGMVGANGRNPRGPSMPVMPRDSAQMQQQRSRSYSTPDINGQTNGRRPSVQSVPAVPGIPAHIHATHERHDSTIPRSNTGSPANDLPIRTNTQSPGAQRAKEAKFGGTMVQFPSQPVYPRQGTPNGGMPPPPGPPPTGMAPLAPVDSNSSISSSFQGQNPLASPGLNEGVPLPTQLKVKVQCDKGIYITLVVAFNITYQSLVDRIDAKLARAYKNSISRGDLRLQYRDEDGDFVAIEGDEDIQITISEWRESVQNTYMSPGGVGEIELFCRGDLG